MPVVPRHLLCLRRRSPQPAVHRGTLQRSGFTLVELLVTAGIFVVGFVAVFGLFLAATKARSRADDLTHLSFASTAIAEELALGGAQTPDTLAAYRGSGGLLPPVAAEALHDPFLLYRYPGIPGIWYRVEAVQDLAGREATGSEDDGIDNASAIARLHLLVYRDTRLEGNVEGLGSTTVSYITGGDFVLVNRRSTMVPGLFNNADFGQPIIDPPREDLGETSDTTRGAALIDRLVGAGLAMRQEIIIPRRVVVGP